MNDIVHNFIENLLLIVPRYDRTHRNHFNIASAYVNSVLTIVTNIFNMINTDSGKPNQGAAGCTNPNV